MGCGLDFGDDHLLTFRSFQKPQLKDLVNGLFKPSESAKSYGIVKRLEILDEAIAIPLCKGRSVGGIRKRKGDRFLIQVALYNKSLHRNGEKRYYLCYKMSRRPVNSMPLACFDNQGELYC
jgi:hypothetical protein